jgi:hypothetical protein
MMPEVPSVQPHSERTNDRNVPDGNGPSKTALPPARLGRSLLSGLRLVWDHLGAALLLSMLGTLALVLSLQLSLLLASALPAVVRTVAVALLALLMLAPLITAAFAVSLRIATHREVAARHFQEALRQFGSVAIRLGLIHFVVGGIMALNLTFYAHLRGPAATLVNLLCLYVALFWAAMALYQGPLLILQESGALDDPERRATRGAKAVVRRSFFLVVGEPLFSIGLGLAALLWTALTLLTAVGAVMLWLGGICILTTPPTLALLAKYGAIDAVEESDVPPTKES